MTDMVLSEDRKFVFIYEKTLCDRNSQKTIREI